MLRLCNTWTTRDPIRTARQLGNRSSKCNRGHRQRSSVRPIEARLADYTFTKTTSPATIRIRIGSRRAATFLDRVLTRFSKLGHGRVLIETLHLASRRAEPKRTSRLQPNASAREHITNHLPLDLSFSLRDQPLQGFPSEVVHKEKYKRYERGKVANRPGQQSTTLQLASESNNSSRQNLLLPALALVRQASFSDRRAEFQGRRSTNLRPCSAFSRSLSIVAMVDSSLELVDGPTRRRSLPRPAVGSNES